MDPATLDLAIFYYSKMDSETIDSATVYSTTTNSAMIEPATTDTNNSTYERMYPKQMTQV